MSDITERIKVVNTENRSNQAGILKNALKMAFGTTMSRILGLLREILLAALFDKSTTDAWNAAFRIPNFFRRLLGEGSISISFVPVFIDAKNHNQARAQNLVNAVYTILLFCLLLITTIGVLKPHWLLEFFLDSHYIQNAEKYLMTQRMAQIMFAFVFFIGFFAFFAGLLNALGQFFWPAFAPTLLNMTMVISTLWPKSWLSNLADKYSDQLAWGVLIGGVLQTMCLIPSLKNIGYFPRFTMKWNTRDVKKVMMNFIPGMVGIGLFQLTSLVNLKFASRFSEGSVSYINYADRLVELPLSLISVSLGTALLPVLSNLWVQNQKEEMSRRAQYYLQLNIFISITAACGLYVLSEPIIHLLFARKLFSLNDVKSTALILKSYCWIMVFTSSVRVVTPIYFAIKNTWLPALTSLVSLGFHILLAPFLMKNYGLQGVMVSTVISAGFNLFLLMTLLKFMIFKFDYSQFFKMTLICVLYGSLIFGLAHSYFEFVKIFPIVAALFITFLLVFFVFIVFANHLFPLEVAKIKIKLKGNHYV